MHVALIHPGVQKHMLYLKKHYCHGMKFEDSEKALKVKEESVYIVTSGEEQRGSSTQRQ